MREYDVVVIGAGMSGLAAAIRVGLAGRSVLLLERHEAPGGLNSFYRKDGRLHDTGLHALTNYAEPGDRRAPLNKIFRQLRIPRETIDCNPQRGSRIHFPDRSLRFGNDPTLLEEEIASAFPAEIDAFRRLEEEARTFPATDLRSTGLWARPFLEERIADPLLREMLLCPILYYGSATEDDLELDQFMILFRALYLEGFARPREGVRTILRPLLKKLKEVGGERRMRCGVRRLVPAGDRIAELELDDGTSVRAGVILSSAGRVETDRLCGLHPPEAGNLVGRLSFVETIHIHEGQPADWGWEDTVVFFSRNRPFRYRKPKDAAVDPDSGVICIPNNYEYPEGRTLPEGIVRVTAIADYDRWIRLPEPEYRQAKEEWLERLTAVGREVLPPPRGEPGPVVATDMFTPRTIEHFTGHLGGAVYGASEKKKDGRTAFRNLFLCGTDQGFLGIVGALLSGISIANRYALAIEGAAAVEGAEYL